MVTGRHHSLEVMQLVARSHRDALAYTLRRISEHNGWCFGHGYLATEGDEPVLVPVRTYYALDPERFEPFRKSRLRSRLHAGQGLPGRAFTSRAVHWADNVAEELRTRRADVGVELRIQCGAAFPILVGDAAVGVLEFFSDQQI